MTHADSPVLFSYALAGPRAGQQLHGEDIVTCLEEETLGWVHLDADHPEADDWIIRHMPYLDDTVPQALTQPWTRSRAARIRACSGNPQLWHIIRTPICASSIRSPNMACSRANARTPPDRTMLGAAVAKRDDNPAS